MDKNNSKKKIKAFVLHPAFVALIGPLVGCLVYYLFFYTPRPDKSQLYVIKEKMENTLGTLKNGEGYCGDEIYASASFLKYEYDKLVSDYGWESEKFDVIYLDFKTAFELQKDYKRRDMEGYAAAMKLLETNVDEWSYEDQREWTRLVHQDSSGRWTNEYMSVAHLDTINAKYQHYQHYQHMKKQKVTLNEAFDCLTWENLKEGSKVFFEKYDVDASVQKRIVSIIRKANNVGEFQYNEAYNKAKNKKRMHGKARLVYLEELLFEKPSVQAEETNKKIVINDQSKLFLCLTWENVRDMGKLFYEKYEVKDSELKYKVDVIVKQANRVGKDKYMRAFKKAKDEPDSLNKLEKHIRSVDLDEYKKLIDEEAKEMAPKFGLG